MDWNELLTPATEDEESKEMDLTDIFREREVTVVDHSEMVYLRGLDYGSLIN